MRGKITGFLLAISFALHASAEPTFPGAIQDAAGIPCTPTCILCHTDIPGTIANLKQPFGITVLSNGAQPGKPESMNAVVAKLRDKKIDTDGDGKIDVDELAVGSNPNQTDPQAELCGPLYGCGAHLARALPPQRAPVICWLVGLIVVSALVVVRRRRSVE